MGPRKQRRDSVNFCADFPRDRHQGSNMELFPALTKQGPAYKFVRPSKAQCDVLKEHIQKVINSSDCKDFLQRFQYVAAEESVNRTGTVTV
jgi:hypothetical protein